MNEFNLTSLQQSRDTPSCPTINDVNNDLYNSNKQVREELGTCYILLVSGT
jgi:hypothetical protein